MQRPTDSETTSSGLRPATLCVHAGHRPSAEHPAVVPRVELSATFLQTEETYAAIEAGRGDEVLIYSRYSNPTVQVVEQKIAALEEAEACLVFSSGMAAMHAALFSLARPGSTIVAARELYGGTIDLLQNGIVPLGTRVVVVDVNDGDALSSALEGDVSVVLCESISNPTLVVANLPVIAQRTHASGAKLIVDATFASPILQRPLRLGADVVMHSATKYLNGHSDVTAGALVGTRFDLTEALAWRKRAGGCLDPAGAARLDRGLRTLALRMQAHVQGATHLARVLAAHPRVRRVYYPGLQAHETHARAEELLDAPGGMLGFEVDGGDPVALRFARSLQLVLDAPSLGGVETLVSLPAYMSHACLSLEERRSIGIHPGLVRVSVGVEDPLDLEQDFLQALDALD